MVFSPWLEGEPLEGVYWGCPGWGINGACPPGLWPCCPVILVLSGEEAASPTVAPEAPCLGTETLVCLGKSACTACTPFQHAWERDRATFLGMSFCIACTIPGMMVVCLGRSACTASTPSLGGLSMPAWEWAPALLVLLPVWGDYHCLIWGNPAYLGLSACTACTSSQWGSLVLGVEDNKEDGAIPFLDTIVKPEADGKLSITVYRKPTHMDQYLQWDSHHHLSAKYSVINTLTHRAKTVCNKPEVLQQEISLRQGGEKTYQAHQWG